jgi:agmatinase
MNEFRDLGGAGLPAPLKSLPWAPAENFLGLPLHEATFEHSSVVILPVPYESTVSYIGGTRFGPRGLIHASRFVELYDHELDAEPWALGVHTLPELLLSGAGPEAALTELRQAIDALLDAGKFVIMLGGEHSISAPPIQAHAARAPHGLSVLQLDAHADLRTEYEGTPYSHACVMYRVHREVGIVPVGIRSLTAEERVLIRRREIPVVWGHEVGQNGWIDRVLQALGEHVYITIDVDYFDPSLVPSTGTPEPGGGTWYPTLALLERVFAERTVVGCDVVELAPIPGLVAPDFLAAKLVYKLVGFYQRACKP